MNLSENSKSYYSEANIYDIFSKAEDSPNKTVDALNEYLAQKNVLDAGCGTGKYIRTLKSTTTSIIGVDKSIHQLEIAKRYNPEISFLNCDLEKLPLKYKVFDATLSCWVLGTILDEKKRLAILENLANVSNEIFLLENTIGSEFEYIRNRHLDSRTLDYNNWLINNGFSAITTIQTYFEFDNIDTAKNIFVNIWGKDVITKIKSSIIEHDVTIYYKKGD